MRLSDKLARLSWALCDLPPSADWTDRPDVSQPPFKLDGDDDLPVLSDGKQDDHWWWLVPRADGYYWRVGGPYGEGERTNKRVPHA